MSTKSTIDAFEDWRRDSEPIVMVTVVRTEGSTYSKAGHRILIAGSGDYQGLVSGGFQLNNFSAACPAIRGNQHFCARVFDSVKTSE